MMICLDPYSILEEERDRLRAELAEKEREIKLLKSDIKEAEVVLATERAARKKAEGLLPDLLAIIKQPSRHGLNWAAVDQSEAILAARAKEGEKR